MNISHLREFIELSKRLNFTATARYMCLTQPALSNHIKALEKEAGMVLVQRCSFGSTGVRLTAGGQRFLQMAKAIVGEYDSAMEELANLHRTMEGTIRIRVPRREYARPLLGYIREFCSLCPSIETVLMPWCETDGYVDVLSGGADCAYAGTRIASETRSVDLVAYASLEIVAWIDADDPLCALDQISVGDLDGRKVCIPANQKSESWVSTMESLQKKFGIGISLDERYCDSLEDFLLNKVGAGDIIIADEPMFGMPGVDLRTERLVKHFSPELIVPSTVAHTCGDVNPAAGLLGDFLRSKVAETDCWW